MAATAGLLGTVAGAALGGEPAGAAGPSGGNAPDGAGELRLGHIRLVTLSHVNDPAVTPLFPGDPEFTLTTAFTIPTDGFYLQYVQEGEHTGSHWGAPGHFEEGGLLADDLDPNDLLLPAVKVDIRAKAAHNPDYALTVADLLAWQRQHGRSRKNARSCCGPGGGPLGYARVCQSRRRRRHPPTRLQRRRRAMAHRPRPPGAPRQ